MAKKQAVDEQPTAGVKSIDKKEIAFELYMAGSSQTKIAQMIGVTENTVGNWKRDGGWDDVKQAINGGGYKIVAAIYRNVLKDIEADPDHINMDQLAKAAKAADFFMPKTKLGLKMYVNVFKEFTSWILTEGKVEMATELVELQNQFLDNHVEENK